MKWLGNVENILNTKEAGKCPICGSDNTDYKATIVRPDGMGYLDIWCNDCKHGFHIEPARITTDVKTTGVVPKMLNYEETL